MFPITFLQRSKLGSKMFSYRLMFRPTSTKLTPKSKHLLTSFPTSLLESRNGPGQTRVEESESGLQAQGYPHFSKPIGNERRTLGLYKPHYTHFHNRCGTLTCGYYTPTQSTNTANDIRDVLASMRLTLIIISAVMLSLVFLGFLFSLFGMQVLVYTLVVFGWILVTGTFILCGIFLLFHNAASDTCVAMHQWVENPTAHTALDEILPCVDPATSQDTLKRSKEVSSQLVDLVNSVISNVSNINFGPQFKPFYFNQSGPLVPFICNPFNPDLTDRTCSNVEVNLNNATQALGNYVCQVDSTGICTTTGRLTPPMYNQMEAAVNVSFGLYSYAPDLTALQDCSVVRDTFTEIYTDHCPGLRRYSRWVYSGLVLVSLAVMLSLILWMVYGRERKYRLYAERRFREAYKKT